MRFWARVGCWVVCCGAAPAFAQTPSPEEPIRFEYAAPAACPDQAAFTARVRERTQRGRVAEPSELARRFSVRISADGGGFGGELEFLDDSGASVSRRVEGEQCDAVVTSLALITALALDASLRSEADESGAELAATPTPASQPLPPSLPRPPPPAPAVPAHPSPSRLSARAGAAMGYDSALGALTWGLLGQLDWRRTWSFRLTAHLASAARTVDERRAELRLMGVELSVCPRLLHGWGAALYACGALDLGSLSAEGIEGGGLVSVNSSTIFWAAAGPGVRLAWEPEAPLWVELQGRVAVPLVSHEFVFEQPPASAYLVEPANVTAGAGVAAGVRF
ncbi:MAG TPA: hypothetical protein VIW29_12800 [Polyangiaceae bacterium]